MAAAEEADEDEEEDKDDTTALILITNSARSCEGRTSHAVDPETFFQENEVTIKHQTSPHFLQNTSDKRMSTKYATLKEADHGQMLHTPSYGNFLQLKELKKHQRKEMKTKFPKLIFLRLTSYLIVLCICQ